MNPGSLASPGKRGESIPRPEGYSPDPGPVGPDGLRDPGTAGDAASGVFVDTPGPPPGLFFRALFSHILISAIAVFFVVIYVNTFRGHKIQAWTHGPFNFECGVYRDYALGRYDIFTTADNKLSKHLLCALLYPVFQRRLIAVFPISDAALVPAFLSGLTLIGFGFWAYWRSGRSKLIFPVLFLLGFSFNTWYVSSVWESRALIMFGAMILLLALDTLVRKPRLASLGFAVVAMTFSILITVGNAYLLPLVPLALLFRTRIIGLRRLAGWSLLYLLAVGVAVGGTYRVMGKMVNPRLQLRNLVELSRHERETILASPDRLKIDNYRNVGLQALVYSVGGLYIPSGDRMCDREWVNENAWRSYFYYPRGIFFASGYVLLVLGLFAVFIMKKLWIREPILWVIAFWTFLYITFFVYFNPYAGSVYAAELQPPLWAAVVLILSRLKTRQVLLFLLLFAMVLFWNNFTVIRYFRYYYGEEEQKTEISRSFLGIPPAPVCRPGGV